ncbi:hypothetical protein AB0M28_07040 [Streptomyces sp. NPDC051940]|uniref:hypothetical protein n=1 Tax=Streptomyces sp. NPDC051940 TaxID=3155675 RepID=UPI00342C1FA5
MPAAWPRLAPLVRSIVKDADPQVTYTARELLGPLAKLAVFADGQGLPATAEVWLSRAVIERFIAVGCPTVGPASRGNYRSRLLKLRDAVLGPELAGGPPVKLSSSTASHPYTSVEQSALWSWASGQATAQLRHGCQTLLALGLGCGLDSPEIVPLRAHDIRIASTGTTAVSVRGRRARLVVCRRPWETVLARAAQEAEHSGAASWLFRPNAHARAKNTVTNFLARTQTDPACPPLVMGRARATWLVGLINAGLPLPVILAGSGVDTLHGLSRLLPHLTPIPAPRAAELLRGD